MLGVLYPHYLMPIPAMAIVQFGLDPGQAELTTGYTVPAQTMLETEPIQGEPCRFRTCYPVTLWPITVESASLSRPPFDAPATPQSARALALLRLSSLPGQFGHFCFFALVVLGFFLKGQPQHIHLLYEMLCNNTLEVALASGRKAPPAILGRDALRQVGFELDEGMLPYPARSFPGYRLLTEFFAFPDKFLFIDLCGLERPTAEQDR